MSYYIGDIFKIRTDIINAYKKGDYIKASILSEKIIEKYEKNNDISSIECARDMYNYGIINDELGNYSTAILWYNKSLEITKNDKISKEYMDTINNIAVDFSLIGDHGKAIKFFKELLNLVEEKYDNLNTDYIYTLYNIANVYENSKDYNKSIEYLKKAFVKSQKKKDFEKSDLADIYFGLGRGYEKIGNYKEAIRNYSSTIKIVENNMSENYFYYMSILTVTSFVCQKAKFYEKSIKYLEKAISIREKIVGKNHTDYISDINVIAGFDYLSNINMLADFYSKNNDYDKAIEIYIELSNLVEKFYSKNHKFYVECFDNIGINYTKKREYEKALKYYNDSISIQKSLNDENDIDLSYTYINMGGLYYEMKDYEKALYYYNEALKIRCDRYGENTLLYVEALNYIADFYLNIKKYKEACETYTRAMVLRTTINHIKNFSKEDTYGYVQNLIESTECFSICGRHKEAIDIIDDGINVRKKIYGQRHPKYADIIFAKSKIFMRSGEYEKAREILEDVLSIRKEMIGENSIDYKEALSLYADSCRLSSHYLEAIESYQKSIDLNFELNIYEKERANIDRIKIALSIFGTGDLKKGNIYFEKAFEHYEKENIIQDEFFYTTILECIEYNLRYNNFNKALYIVDKAYKVASNIHSENEEHNEYIIDLTILKSKIYQEMGELDNALMVLKEKLDNIDNLDNINNKVLTRIYITISNIYSKKNDDENMLSSLLKAEKIADRGDYIYVLNTIGDIYFGKKEYDKALYKFNTAKSYIEEYNITNDDAIFDIKFITEYIHAIELIGDIYGINEEYEKQILIYELEMEYVKKLNLADKIIENSMNLYKLYMKINDTSKAIEYMKEMSNNILKKYGENEEYVDSLIKIFEIYEMESKYDEAYKIIKNVENICQRLYGEDNSNTLYAMSKIGDISYLKGDISIAKNIYEKLYGMYKLDNNFEYFNRDRYINLKKIYKINREYKNLIKLKFKK